MAVPVVLFSFQCSGTECMLELTWDAIFQVSAMALKYQKLRKECPFAAEGEGGEMDYRAEY